MGMMTPTSTLAQLLARSWGWAQDTSWGWEDLGLFTLRGK